MEGAQGYQLDIDNGDYPYVTSSNCITGNIFLNGISSKLIPSVHGIAKLYDTYVGSKIFQTDEEVFNKLADIGNEYGSTTGRKRQCNWLNLDKLVEAIVINNVDYLYINKCDVIEKLNVFKVILQDQIIDFNTLKQMKEYLIKYIHLNTDVKKIIFSFDPSKL